MSVVVFTTLLAPVADLKRVAGHRTPSCPFHWHEPIILRFFFPFSSLCTLPMNLYEQVLIIYCLPKQMHYLLCIVIVYVWCQYICANDWKFSLRLSALHEQCRQSRVIHTAKDEYLHVCMSTWSSGRVIAHRKKCRKKEGHFIVPIDKRSSWIPFNAFSYPFDLAPFLFIVVRLSK